MNDAIRRSGDLPLDFAFGPKPKDEEAAAAFRLSDLRRSAGSSRRGGLTPRANAARHVLWRDGVARIREA